MRQLRWIAVVMVVAVSSGVAGAAGAVPPGAARDAMARTAPAITDFNGDGYGDLAVAAPGEDVGGITDAGNVTIAYGEPGGPSGAGAQVVRQGLTGVPGAAEAGDWFGSAVAAGDFDGDGFSDLAVGASLEDVGTVVDTGNVTVVPGGAGGLQPGGARVLRQGAAPVPGTAEADDLFGYSVAAGDLDGDGRDDLAIGAPFEAVGPIRRAGNVTVVFGAPGGLGAGRASVVVRQGLGGLAGTPETDDNFGVTVAAGDIDGDGRDDLVVGAPGEAVGPVPVAGNITFVPGAARGPDLAAGWPLNAADTVIGTVQPGAHFGLALATGDVNVDGFADVAVGTPFWDAPGAPDAGNVTVVFGTAERISPTQVLDQGMVGQLREAGDEFARSVAVGDLNGDGAADLIVGSPREDAGAVVDTGSIVVVNGAGAEFPGAHRWFDQSALGGAREPGDVFGFSLTVGELDGDGIGDLSVSAPEEAVGAVADAGNVTVARGGPGGLSATRAFPLNQRTLGGTPEPGDVFGLQLR